MRVTRPKSVCKLQICTERLRFLQGCNIQMLVCMLWEAMPTAVVAYYRVSTPRQGRSGLGLEAQRKAVAAYAASHGAAIADEFTEIETGKGADALERRPCVR